MNRSGRIFQRGGIWWISFYAPDPNDRTRKKEFRLSTRIRVETKSPPRACAQMLQEYTTQITIGNFTPNADKVRFDDLVDGLWQDYKLNMRVSLKTARCHQANLRPFWSRIAPLNYSEALNKKYKTLRMEAGAAIATINREIAHLNHMMRLAIEDKKLPYLPPLKLFPKEQETIREGFLEPGDFYNILSAIAGWRRDFVEFCYLAGWRCGKVRGLEWKQVFLNADKPYIRHLAPTNSTKQPPKDLPLTGRLLEIIQACVTRRDVACSYVFHRKSQQVKEALIRLCWYRACVEKGYMAAQHKKGQRLLIHDFRRSMARNMDEIGVSQKTIMDRGGWRNPSMFLRYRIGSNDDQARANEKLENYIEAHRVPKVEKINEN